MIHTCLKARAFELGPILLYKKHVKIKLMTQGTNQQQQKTCAVIGARGDMGRSLTDLFKKNYQVLEIDRGSDQTTWDQAWQADIIWLSIPRQAVPELMNNRKLRSDQVVVDICSVKRGLNEIIKNTGAIHLSLHPLHGSNLPLTGQRWVLVPTENSNEVPYPADQILEFLKERGITIFPAQNEEHHDLMMGLTLCLPEILTLTLEDMRQAYLEQNQVEPLDQNDLMRWAVPASNSLFGAYYHIINSTPEWLRLELIENAYGQLLTAAQKGARNFSQLEAGEIKKRVKKQSQLIKEIPEAERQRIRRWVEEWFADSTKTFFKQESETRTKPALKIQWSEKADQLFPENKEMSVGIHGIDGCFTQEALERFLEESGIPIDRAKPTFLITAEEVLKSVAAGQTDYGIFGLANSGSGAYVTSLGPIGDYRFRVKAVIGMEIMQCLLAHPETSFENIGEIFGHPQAVSQCRHTLAEHYPDLTVRYGTDEDDTALVAKQIAEGELPPETATLASQLAAKRYHLQVLSYNMHHDPNNTTTFLLVSQNRSADK